MMADVDDAASSLELALSWSRGEDEAAKVLLARAAVGQIEAQRVLAQGFADIAYTGAGEGAAYLAGSELLARMAASHGGAGDRRRLAGVLSLYAAHDRAQGQPASATSLETECLVILSGLADEGYEEAAEAMNALAETFSREAVEAAQVEAKGSIATMQEVRIVPPPLVWAAPLPDDVRAGQTLTPVAVARLWLEDRLWSVRFYFEDVWFALGSLGRALIGRV